MSLKFIPDNRTQKKELIKLLKKADKIRCAVAFWGKGASQLLGKNLNKDIKIICNLQSGGTNPNEIERIFNKTRSHIRQNDKLHAKIYWTECGVIIGSSNFSGNGINFDTMNNGNDEANILVTDNKIIHEVDRWFNNHWNKALKISIDEIEEAKRLWRLRVKRRDSNWTGGHILTRLKNNTINDEDAIFLFYSKDGALDRKDVSRFMKEKNIVVPKNFDWWEESNPTDTNSEFKRKKENIKKWLKYPDNICIALTPDNRFDFKEPLYVSKIIDNNGHAINHNNNKILISLNLPIKDSELIGNRFLDRKLIKLLNKSIEANYKGWKKIIDRLDTVGGYCSISDVKKLIKNVEIM
jgi:hypothetical protein